MNPYEDIMNAARPEPIGRRRMPTSDRAAQFLPFAALSGYDDAVAETARITEKRRELGEEEQRALNEALQRLRQNIHAHPLVTARVFQPDIRKAGGAYITVTGRARYLDECEGEVLFCDGKSIAIENMSMLEINDDEL